MYTTGNTTNSVLSLSPELIKELAEYAVKEHRAGRCLTQEQVEKSVMETMGWSSPSSHEQEVVVSDCINSSNFSIIFSFLFLFICNDNKIGGGFVR